MNDRLHKLPLLEILLGVDQASLGPQDRNSGRHDWTRTVNSFASNSNLTKSFNKQLTLYIVMQLIVGRHDHLVRAYFVQRMAQRLRCPLLIVGEPAFQCLRLNPNTPTY